MVTIGLRASLGPPGMSLEPLDLAAPVALRRPQRTSELSISSAREGDPARCHGFSLALEGHG
jgi:hypothetical protein